MHQNEAKVVKAYLTASRRLIAASHKVTELNEQTFKGKMLERAREGLAKTEAGIIPVEQALEALLAAPTTKVSVTAPEGVRGAAEPAPEAAPGLSKMNGKGIKVGGRLKAPAKKAAAPAKRIARKAA